MKFLSSEKAISEVVGFAIILGLTITGIAMIALVGVPSIYKLQDMATVKDAEQAFTLSDSKVSGTFLGDAPMRMGKINLGGGTVAVEPNGTGKESYIVIMNENNTFNITIPMGKVKYSYGERTVGYEGGGIWSKYPSGGSIMLSSPEFHYDGRTLTLPVLTVNGNSTMGGKGTAAVTFKKNSTIVLFPNTTLDKNRSNPLNYSISGNINMKVTSDFYDAWASYAKSLFYTTVSTNPSNHTTSIVLRVVPSTLGGNTEISPSFSLRGIPTDDDTPIDNFSFKIEPEGNGLDWDIRAKTGNKTLIFHIFGTSVRNAGDKADLYIGFQDAGPGYSKPAETWIGTNKLIAHEEDDDLYIDVDLLNTSLNMKYNSKTVGATNSCGSINKVSSGSFNDTGPGFSWGTPLTIGGEKPLYNLTQHYIRELAQGGVITFNQCSPSSNQAPDEDSTMMINYSATGDVTFLHISNSIADVSIS